jgi:3-oxoacyl-[acyl-carrier-protein] synthase-3
MVKAAKDALHKSGLTIDQIDHVIPHQANLRIIDAIHERLGVPREKFIINLDRYGNTSAASVVLALDEAAKQGLIKKHDIVLMIAFGGGFTWGASIVEWYK